MLPNELCCFFLKPKLSRQNRRYNTLLKAILSPYSVEQRCHDIRRRYRYAGTVTLVPRIRDGPPFFASSLHRSPLGTRPLLFSSPPRPPLLLLVRYRVDKSTYSRPVPRCAPPVLRLSLPSLVRLSRLIPGFLLHRGASAPAPRE